MGQDIGYQVGSSVGLVEVIDTDENEVGWEEYLRVKIRMDLSKPFLRGCVLKLKEGEWSVARGRK